MKTRILNILIVFAIVIGFLPQQALAIEERNKTYIYDNFTVDYNITGQLGWHTKYNYKCNKHK